MSDRLKRKSILVILIGVVCLVLLGIFLTNMQTALTLDSQKVEIEQKLDQMDELLADADSEGEQHEVAYDQMYKSKAATLAYLVRKEVDPVLDDAQMLTYQTLLNVDNALILDKEGNVITAAKTSRADFTRNRYNQLRTVFDEGKLSDPFEVEDDGKTYRYYGAMIDDDRMAVIEHDPAELKHLLDTTVTWSSILSNVNIGMSGFAFAVSDKDYTFLAYPSKEISASSAEEMVGKDALDAGIPVEELEDRNYTWINVAGEELYCGITHIDGAYVFCAIPESEIASSRMVTVGIVLFVFFAVMTLVIAYALLTLRANEREAGGRPEDYQKIFGFYFNKVIGRKIVIMSVIGMICIIIVSFYMQTLFSLSRRSMSNNARVHDIEEMVGRYNEDIELLREQYNTRYLNKCRAAAYILEHKPEFATREDLGEISSVLEVQQIRIYDAKGSSLATNSNTLHFTLSEDPESQSYEFRRLLNGQEELVQEARTDDVLGLYRQYIGVTLHDEEGLPDGFVQISVLPEALEKATENLSISAILDGTKVGKNGFAFAVNKEDLTFAYYPEEKYIGRSAQEYGMEDRQFKDGYCDYIKVDGKRYYTSSLELEDYYVYVVIPAEELNTSRILLVLSSVGVSIACLLVMFLLLTFRKSNPATKPVRKEKKEKRESQMVDVVMPDGSVKKTEAAASRWSNNSIRWSNKTPEQQFSTVLRCLLALFALVICVSVLLKDRVFGSNSIFMYVINGSWERGVNIFALTADIMIICVIWAATIVLRKILQLLAQTFNAHGETVCRLLSNLVKYVAVIAGLYYCFAMLGVDTATLLASAGILSLIIGLGAQKLVGDILAGLFIIFEGEFRVGDIVTVGDWRGTVMEIGIRTTKIVDSGNVKVFSNSAISGIINMTRQHSYASCTYTITDGTALQRLEKILAEELPKMKKRLPDIQEGPVYEGVTALNGGGVSILINAKCAENVRGRLIRDLNREMRLLFDKYEIK